MPNRAVDRDSRARSACYPRSTFYPLSDGPSTQSHRIIRPHFRVCLTRRSRSQAGLYPYAPRTVTVRAEPTFGHLRYTLGGDRPSQTARLPLSFSWLTTEVRIPTNPGWYFTVGSALTGVRASSPPTYPTQNLPKPNDKLQ